MKRWLPKAQLIPFKRLALLIAFSCAGTAAHADTSTGKITAVHLNGDYPDRGACIQMNPALPGMWACLFKSNSAYKELTALLLAGSVSGKTCTVTWNPANAAISWAECY